MLQLKKMVNQEVLQTLKLETTLYLNIYLKKYETINDFENKKFGVYILKFSDETEMQTKMNKINDLIFIKT